MSTLETNSIGKYSGNNVSVDDALNLKSYTTTQRNALASVAGDSIYNTTTGKVEYYNGSAWVATGASSFAIEYLTIAGGGSGGGSGQTGSGGGGAGGYLNSYASETSGANSSTASTYTTYKDTNYTVTVGAGGASVSGGDVAGNEGNNSIFDFVVAIGGGSGGARVKDGKGGGSGGGSGAQVIQDGGNGLPLQGKDGGAVTTANTPYPGGGGGGASADGGDGTSGGPGAGGNGLSSSITGSAVTRAAGGGGGNYNGAGASGGTGGGGTGGGNSAPHTGTAGTVNTGSGGGGCSNNAASGAGGSGIVILRYATADATITVGAGLTSSSATDGSDTVVTFTAGTGTVSFS